MFERAIKNKQYSKMQNSNGQLKQSQNNKGHVSMHKIIFQLRELNEVQDESRNQQSPFYEQTNIQQKHSHGEGNGSCTSSWSQSSSRKPERTKNILDQLEDDSQKQSQKKLSMQEKALQKHHFTVETRNTNIYSHHTGKTDRTTSKDQTLKRQNQKLFQDNSRLFGECVRLKKMMISQKYQVETQGDSETSQYYNNNKNKKGMKPSSLFIKNKHKHSQREVSDLTQFIMQRINKLEEENLNLKKQLDLVIIENVDMSEDIEKMQENIQKQKIQEVSLKTQNKYLFQIDTLKVENKELKDKINQITKELQLMHQSRVSGKSSQSSSTTIHHQSPKNSNIFQSKKTEAEKQRTIMNMKVVYDSEIKKLKSQLDEQRREISLLENRSEYGLTDNLYKR